MGTKDSGVSRRGFLGLAGGLTAAAAVASSSLVGCAAGEAGGPAKTAPSSTSVASALERAGISAPTSPHANADGNYNIILIVTDQEHYYDRYPEGTDFRARELLAELGTTFEKHYACFNMSTSSRAVMYTGTHVTENLMRDNVEFP